jgi:hypothetical protein
MKARSTNASPRASRLGKWFLLLFSALPVLVSASLKVITLSELIRRSDVIARGDLQPPMHSGHSGAVASLHVISVLKGESAQSQDEIPLCNGRVDSENPDLATLRGNYVAFLAKKGECFYLVWGWDALIVVRSDRAHTGGIEDQPLEQPLEEFLHKIESQLKK